MNTTQSSPQPQEGQPPPLTEEEQTLYLDLLSRMAAVIAAAEEGKEKEDISLPPLACQPSPN